MRKPSDLDILKDKLQAKLSMAVETPPVNGFENIQRELNRYTPAQSMKKVLYGILILLLLASFITYQIAQTSGDPIEENYFELNESLTDEPNSSNSGQHETLSTEKPNNTDTDTHLTETQKQTVTNQPIVNSKPFNVHSEQGAATPEQSPESEAGTAYALEIALAEMPTLVITRSFGQPTIEPIELEQLDRKSYFFQVGIFNLSNYPYTNLQPENMIALNYNTKWKPDNLGFSFGYGIKSRISNNISFVGALKYKHFSKAIEYDVAERMPGGSTSGSYEIIESKVSQFKHFGVGVSAGLEVRVFRDHYLGGNLDYSKSLVNKNFESYLFTYSIYAHLFSFRLANSPVEAELYYNHMIEPWKTDIFSLKARQLGFNLKFNLQPKEK